MLSYVDIFYWLNKYLKYFYNIKQMSEKPKSNRPGAQAAKAARKYTNSMGITTPQTPQTHAARKAQIAAFAASHPPLPLTRSTYVTGGKSKSKNKPKSKSKK